MIDIHTLITKTYDEKAKVTGFLETKSLRMYEKEDNPIPTEKGIDPTTPCLMIEVIDEENSTADLKIMKPIASMRLSEQQAKFIKDYFNTIKKRGFEAE